MLSQDMHRQILHRRCKGYYTPRYRAAGCNIACIPARLMHVWGMKFSDRRSAGRALAQTLLRYRNAPDTIVLALPRGGVPVAFEVARVLELPLDVFIVRKIGAPGNEEYALGAIASGGIRIFNRQAEALHLPVTAIEAVTQREERELERRERAFRDDQPAPQIAGRTVILVDDGLATGSSMRAAALAVRRQNPARIVVAVPVAAPDVCEEFRTLVDEVECAINPEAFHAVGLWYENFEQTTDEEVRALLEEARAGAAHTIT